MISILLMSDIHFGVDTAAPYIDDSIRQMTFNKICMLARQHTMFIIAGDMFHAHVIDTPIFSFIINSLQALLDEGVKIVYVPGDAELANNDHPDRVLAVPSTVTFYGNKNDYHTLLEFGSEVIHCYGSQLLIADQLHGIAREGLDGFHIGVFHVDLGDDNYNNNGTIPVKSLKSMPLDFYALGHHHNFSMYKFKNRIVGAYPGSPEAVTPDEIGDRYVLSITVENNEIHQIKRITVNSVKMETVTIQCDSVHSQDELSAILQRYNKSNIVLQCTLEGMRSFDTTVISALCNQCAELVINDHSKPSSQFICNRYKQELSLRGYFYSELHTKIASESPPYLQEIIDDIENTCSLFKGEL
ncbi:MAG TPA: hypothetical protein PLH80_04055 [Spirochaetota bacterium]|nr:hypothetical protein [Spirochaetota bacterium]HOM88347.1 hypothetical protein [Spirochaetota bacterium]HOT19023.1 hypothetical protein [Spirochaetota bacterium]HQG42668.1 hypothetical protein [Spirochaetota bacterium]HQI37719.1 hypothetical protein [Spirochaetota bacterium]